MYLLRNRRAKLNSLESTSARRSYSRWSLTGLLEGLTFLATTVSLGIFYAVCQKDLHVDWKTRLRNLPIMLSMGVGICWLALTHSCQNTIALPPHLWDGQRDRNLPRLALVNIGQTIKAKSQAALMSNSFGFGGSNCSIIIQSHF